MRAAIVAAGFLMAGCTGISSVSVDDPGFENGQLLATGTPYSLPKGVVPVQVFIDADGIGLTVEPAQIITDNDIGILVAHLNPSVFNDEKMTLVADPSTGFLSSVSSESTARILDIATEAGKLAGRLSLQSAKAAFFEGKVVLLEDSFDPQSDIDVIRINGGINAAIARAATGRIRQVPQVSLRVEPSATTVRAAVPPASEPDLSQLKKCKLGVCARTMVSRTIRVELDGRSFGTKVVNVPSRHIVPVPVPQTILADQKVTVTIKDGILSNYELDRKSELLGLVKIPGAVIGGVFSGMKQGLDDTKDVVDKQKDLVKSETELAKAQKEKIDATKIVLQSGTDSSGKPVNAYMAMTLTLYAYSAALGPTPILLRQTKPLAPQPAVPGPRPGDDDLTSPAKKK
jgi:hypothetical protein